MMGFSPTSYQLNKQTTKVIELYILLCFHPTTLTWFTFLFKQQSPLLHDLNVFVEEFSGTFENSNKKHTSTNKLQALRQGPCLVAMYTSNFRQLICNISWDKTTFMSQFQYGSCNNVKDLLLTMLDPSTLSQTIE